MNDASGSGRELDPLWEKLEDLKRLDSGLTTASVRRPERTTDQIRAEIESRLGFFPPFFAPALASPPLLEGLWSQQFSCYYDNPLPELYKEKLSTILAQYCASSYFIVTHACMLYKLGMAAREIELLLEGPDLAADNLEHVFETLAQYPHPVDVWPVGDPEFDEKLMVCCAAVFLGTEGIGALRRRTERDPRAFQLCPPHRFPCRCQNVSCVDRSASGSELRRPPGRPRKFPVAGSKRAPIGGDLQAITRKLRRARCPAVA